MRGVFSLVSTLMCNGGEKSPAYFIAKHDSFSPAPKHIHGPHYLLVHEFSGWLSVKTIHKCARYFVSFACVVTSKVQVAQGIVSVRLSSNCISWRS